MFTGFLKYFCLVIFALCFSSSAQPLVEDKKYTLGDLGGPYNGFGQDVELTPDFVFISSKNVGGDERGEIWVYSRDSHELVHRITPPEQFSASSFGTYFSIAGHTLVTTSFARDEQGDRVVIVYVVDLNTFDFVNHFQTSSHPISGFNEGLLQLGTNGELVAVLNSSGPSSNRKYSAVVYDLDTGSEMMSFYELVDSPVGDGSELSGPFLMVDNLLVVSMAKTKPLRPGQVFVYDLNSGETVHALSASQPSVYSQFGKAIAMHANHLLVAAPNTYLPNAPESLGVVHLIDLNTGEEIFSLSQPARDSVWRDEVGFGYDVAISDKYIIVGCPSANGLITASGLVYLFEQETGHYIATLSGSDNGSGDYFGLTLAIEGNEAIITSPGDDEVGANSGAVYQFASLPCSRVDLAMPRHVIDSEDVLAFLELIVTGDLYADFNDDGLLNFFDVSAFLQAFAAGCP